MKGTDGEKRERRRRVWKTAGLALLGLMGGSSGCQWIGGRSLSEPAGEPPALIAPGSYRPQTAAAPATTTPAASAAETPQTAAPASLQPASHEVASTGEPKDAAVRQAVATNSPAEPSLVPASAQVTAETAKGPQLSPTPPAAPARTDEPAAAPAAAPASPAKTATAAQVPDEPADENTPRRERRRPAGKDQGYQVDWRLPSPAEGIATPTIPEPPKSLPITLSASLALAGVENPVINMADQAIRVALGEQMAARVLLVPSVNVGGDFHNHSGPVLASFGGIRKITRNIVNYGLGVNTVAAESIKIPGLFINAPLTDAIFAPLAARQVVNTRRFTARATRNHVLLEVATGYLALLGAEGRLAVIRQSEKDFDEVVRLTGNYAKTGQGTKADADRAMTDSLALRYDEQEAQEQVAVASAELCQLLNLDPSTRLNTADVPIQLVQFVDPKMPLPKLLEIATRNRPELLAAAANVRASQVRVKQEKLRPFLPVLWAGFSADAFGGGATASTNGNVPNPHGDPSPGGAASAATGGQTVPKFGRITGRTDVDVMAIWTLRNAGMGNLGLIKIRRSELGVAEAERVHMLNHVAQEVSEAYNTSAAQFRAIEIERRRVQEATDGFQRDLIRIRAGEGRPIEVLNQAKRLVTARKRLLEALITFDRAQFQLFVALGQPPTLAVDEDKPPPPPPPGVLPPPAVLTIPAAPAGQ